ncbi:MAG: sodium:solute symporter [Bacteroidales bacterium]|nr:sodium:solute symporter [Bacteroidales bacterium]MDD4234829.1 sodium:solute symporter [Bacteroidales bacterium]
MSPALILGIIASYFLLLIVISILTSRNANSEGFFLGNRKSPWFVVAFGMLGASLSGVTFISVPGWVQDTQMTYMQMVLGYVVGYFTIAHLLLPIYYKLNLTSIYTYLDNRFGISSYKTGSAFFLLSRTIGASFRLFIVATVLQVVIFDAWNVPFFVTVLVTIVFIWLYTFRGGIKTIIWTDTLQTAFLLLAVIITIIMIGKELDLGLLGMAKAVSDSQMSRIFVFDDWVSKQHFLKQFVSGAFITIVMTGLDQDMMQKNLSCRNLKDAQKNMKWYGIAFVPANLLFMSLGVLLMLFAQSKGIAPDSELIHADKLYPYLAAEYLGPVVMIIFILGLMASAYSSADSALTALTTSFTVDILNAGKKEEKRLKKIRTLVHIMFSVILMLVIIVFRIINDKSVVDAIFTVAGYTYGPLLGMFAFGLLTKKQIRDKLVPIIAIISPLISLGLYYLVKYLANGYKLGYEILLINGLICFVGLYLISFRNNRSKSL